MAPLWLSKVLLFFAVATLLAPCCMLAKTTNDGIPGWRNASRYKFDLDLPPENRWTSVLQNFDTITLQKQFQSLVEEVVSEKLPQPVADLFPIIKDNAKELDDFIPEPFSGEMRGIARDLKIDLGELVLLNLLYDTIAFCTSIVAENSDNQIWHGRNLDYSFPSHILRNITVELEGTKNGSTSFYLTTYVGYVGVLTGLKPGAFSISLDERHKGSLWENLWEAIKALTGRTWPVSFLTRNVLENEKDFDGALNQLTYTPVIAPVYYILGGIDTAAVITRNRESALDVWKLEPKQKVWFLVETNFDHWTQPPASDDRRDPAIKALNRTGQVGFNNIKMFDVLSVPPVLNNNTEYKTIMSATNSYYQTYIPV